MFGSVGRSASLELRNAGCGDWTIANVAGPRASGPGRLGEDRPDRPLDLRLAAGAGRSMSPSGGAVRGCWPSKEQAPARWAQGSVNLDDRPVRLEHRRLRRRQDPRRATVMPVSVAGSGDVEFGGAAASLTARIAGSGNIRAKDGERRLR